MHHDSADNPTNTRMRRLLAIAAVLWILCCCLTISSCREDSQPLLPLHIDPEVFPTMSTYDVSTLISDSGVTRYKIVAPTWFMFEEAKEPKWRFPEGMHIEKYDNFFRKDATIDCDSATFFKDKQLWRLDGHVRIANTIGERFLTNQLFWNQRKQEIYSDSFIHIERADRIIEGYGFESNEQMTRYRVIDVSGIFPVSQFKNEDKATADSAQTDTIAAIETGDSIQTSKPGNRMSRVRTSQRKLPKPQSAENNKQASTVVQPAVKATADSPLRRKPQRHASDKK